MDQIKIKNSILLVNKPEGPTSHDIVYKMRKILGIREIGHTGTLDPFATGLLVLLTGEATKLSSYITDTDKEYVAKLCFGKTSDTYDKTGKVCEREILKWPTLEEVGNAVKELVGNIQIQVPEFSAVKVDGVPLHRLARQGKATPKVERTMIFHSVEILDYRPPELSVRIKCGKGAYIRAWAHELGQRTELGAILIDLCRTQVGDLKVESALGFSKDLDAIDTQPEGSIIAMSDALGWWPQVKLNEDSERLAQNGLIPKQVLDQLSVYKDQLNSTPIKGGVRLVSGATGNLISIVLPIDKSPWFKVGRVFHS